MHAMPPQMPGFFGAAIDSATGETHCIAAQQGALFSVGADYFCTNACHHSAPERLDSEWRAQLEYAEYRLDATAIPPVSRHRRPRSEPDGYRREALPQQDLGHATRTERVCVVVEPLKRLRAKRCKVGHPAGLRQAFRDIYTDSASARERAGSTWPYKESEACG